MKVLLLSLGLAAALSSQARLPRGPRARELESASAALGVRAPWNAPKWVWKRAYRSHRALLPLLHFRDACRPADANVNETEDTAPAGKPRRPKPKKGAGDK